MSSYIEAAVLGRLGSSQMQRRTGAGKPFVTLSIAVSTGQGDPAEWVSVACFGKVMETLPDYAVAERGRLFIQSSQHSHGSKEKGGTTSRSRPQGEPDVMSDSDGTDTAAWGEAPVLPRRRKTGGRQKGTPNKKNAARAEILASLKVSGQDPIAFFTSILKNNAAPLELRFQAAKEVAPYLHPKLSSIEARTGGASHEDRLQRLLNMMEDDRPSLR